MDAGRHRALLAELSDARGRGTAPRSRSSSPIASASRSSACALDAARHAVGARGQRHVRQPRRRRVRRHRGGRGRAVGAKLRALAAHAARGRARTTSCSPDGPRGRPRRARSRAWPSPTSRGLAYSPPRGGLPPGMPPGLEATVYFDPPGPDVLRRRARRRGRGRSGDRPRAVTRYVVVEDCGPVINPLLVEGQIHGAVAQGARRGAARGASSTTRTASS